jgi:hypothetical protein
MLVGLGAAALLLVGLAAPAGAIDMIEYCDEVPTELPQPWSSTYEVPLPTRPGARISYVELVDSYGETYFGYYPTSPFMHPDGGVWVSEQVCEERSNSQVVGKTLITKVEGRLVGLFGYAFDPGMSDNVQVSVSIDGAWRPQYWTANYPWVSTPTFPAEATDKGFLILMGDFPVGEHEICVIAQDIEIPSQNVNLGCTRVVVK